jgi:hypothetical protein
MRLSIAVGAALAATTFAVAPAVAQDEKGAFGLGLIIGEPTGVSAKLYLGDDTAIDAAIGGAVIGRGVQVHADFLWHPWIIASEASFVMPLYLGIGGRLLDHDRGRGEEDDLHLGVRFPVGFLFDFKNIPIDVFIEVALIADFRGDDERHDKFGIDLNAGAGARYYF